MLYMTDMVYRVAVAKGSQSFGGVLSMGPCSVYGT